MKTDNSPVTIDDRRAEEIIKEVLLAEFPEHGFYGEESGKEQADAEYLWLVDPIDGTKSFIGGYGMFSTQIALMHRSQLVLGVSSAPAAGEIAWGLRGGGAFIGEFAAIQREKEHQKDQRAGDQATRSPQGELSVKSRTKPVQDRHLPQ